MNIDELAQHIQKLFSEKLKLNFDLEVFKDALGHLDPMEIDDLSVYVDSLAKFGSEDSVIKKMLEAVCSEKECGKQLTELLNRWNGIFPDNPIPAIPVVPALKPEVVSTANNGLIAATVVLGILCASLLAGGTAYIMHRRATGSVNLEDHFKNNIELIGLRSNVEMIDKGTMKETDRGTIAGSPLKRSASMSDLPRDAFPDATEPLSRSSSRSDLSQNASAVSSKSTASELIERFNSLSAASPVIGKSSNQGTGTHSTSTTSTSDLSYNTSKPENLHDGPSSSLDKAELDQATGQLTRL
ncbi:hypothetical protein NSE_0041 [Neorickettsia sennetsu str. Miyayama]|uniref:Uncharacterized protein n=2 Tax=Ehrlichia sennetsu TaxID=951 RepID=Q2GF13_EHRS3|nr:hypothetical protein NSE_0041 [Neorickettsia sennetsu str. Miyayama]